MIFSGAISVPASASDVRAGAIPAVSLPAAKTLTATVPVISGTARVGRTLIAVAGTWTVGTSFTYQWLRNGAAISGATKTSYILTSADLGKRITVTVKGSLTGYTTLSKTSVPTAVVALGILATKVPTVSGIAQVEKTLTATPGAWTSGTALTYQWLRDGLTIAGATQTTYKITAADLGKKLSVRVRGTKLAYVTATKTSLPTAAVIRANLVAPVPKITGTARVDVTLGVTTGTWSAGATLSYQWLRDGTTITGSTRSTYKVAAADVGKKISVRIKGTKPGFNTTTKTSLETAAVIKATLLTATPSIVGVARVGQELTVAPGSWSAGTVFTYQWLRDGAPMLGATASTYTPVAGDIGKKISVTLIGSKPGYNTVTKSSSQTAPVVIGVLKTAIPTVAGIAQVDKVLTAAPGTWTTGVAFTYQWLRNGVAISGATQSTYKVAPADVGTKLSARISGTQAGYTTATTTSILTSTVIAGVLSTSTPVITGTAQVDKTLTAAAGTWTSGTALSYQWLRDGTAITGATQTTYKVAAADVGKKLSVRVGGTKAGYTTVTTTSALTAAVIPAAATAPTPMVTGIAQVGKILTAVPGTWPTGTTLAYRWLRDGVAITGATQVTYSVAAADQGTKLSVQVTGTTVGSPTITMTSAATATVIPGTLTPSTPTVTGTAQVESTLTAVSGSWTSGTTLSYQWLRDGTAITAATQSTYKAVAADLGSKLSVRVTGSKAGYTTTSATSVLTASVIAAVLSTAIPTITGTAQVDATLTAVSGSWTTGTTLTYQWLRDGTTITGATQSTYKAVAADLGSKLSVRVTGSKAGYTTASATSVLTATVIPGVLVNPTPTITGSSQVGKTLTAGPGTWTTGTTLSYQWLRGGSAITGATSASYDIVASDLGTTLSVRVTGSKAGYTTASATSAATATVIPGVLVNPTPTITGTAQVESTLTAVSGSWTTGTTLTYQWLRDGTAITGATQVTYKAVAADLGSKLSVRVSGAKAGYLTTSVASALTASVIAAVLATATPTITGTAQVEQTLTAVPGVWTTGTTLSYQWLRDGTAITGATQITYKAVAADLGSKLSVRVTGSKAGYLTASVTSALTATVIAAVLTTATPTITGTAQVDATLTAVPGSWTSGTSLSYQWLRDGTAITGATQSTYTAVAADLGTKLSVRVTGTKAGYTTASATSALTATVIAAPVNAPTPTITGSAQVDATLSVVTGTWPTGTTLAYQWLRNGVAITGATGVSYVIRPADVGLPLSIEVTGTKTGTPTITKTSTETALVVLAILLSPTPTVTGTAQVGQTLTAVPGTWSTGTALSYQWLRGGTAITGATAATYVLTAADLGTALSVRLTGTKAGYTTATTTSVPTGLVIPGILINPTPTITGTAQVGLTLTAVPGTWSTGTALSYQWLRGGIAITGATASTYVITADDLNATLSVRVTGAKAGYLTANSTSASTMAVAPATWGEVVVSISGSAQMDATLTANPGVWPVGTTLAYQWLRNGVAITGAAQSTYTLVVADVGTKLSVQVLASKPGYLPITKTSAQTATVIPGVLPSITPLITGTAQVGQSLTAVVGSWPAGTTLSYQWRRDGAVISGATSLTYLVATADLGTDLSVRVQATKPGYTTVLVTSSDVPVSQTSTVLQGDISTNTTLLPGLYVVPSSFQILAGATLTIPAGTILKFANGAGLTVLGGLTANGTAAAPVVLTSIADDSRGGDTNGDGGATAPSAGIWSGIVIQPGAAVRIDRSVLAYASNTTSFEARSFELLNSTLTQNIGGVQVWRYNDFERRLDVIDVSGNTLDGSGGINVYSASEWGDTVPVKVMGNTVSSTDTNQYPISVSDRNMLPSFLAGNSVAGSTMKAIGIDGKLLESWTIPAGATKYVFTSAVEVPAGITLEIQAGTVVKLHNGGWLDVYGALVLSGTAANAAVLTSIHDDSRGGDTNANGAATTPSIFDSSGITMQPGASLSMDRAVLAYSGGVYAPEAASVLITNSLLANNGSGINAWRSDGFEFRENRIEITGNTLQASGQILVDSQSNWPDTLPVQVSGNTVIDPTAGQYPIQISDAQMRPSQFTGNVVSGSKVKAIGIQGVLAESWTMPSSGTQVYVLYSTLQVAAGASLLIPAGTVLKADNGAQLVVNGTLTAIGTAAAPVVLTSFHDDSRAGDSNGNSGATSPAAGNWSGIQLGELAVAKLDHAVLNYGGGINGSVAVSFEVLNSSMTDNYSGVYAYRSDGFESKDRIINISGNTLLRSGAIDVTNWNTATDAVAIQVKNNTVTNPQPGYPINIYDVRLTPSQFVGNTVTGSKQPAIGINGTIVEDWTMPTSGSPRYVDTGYLIVDADSTLTMPAGTVLKFEAGAWLDIQGSLLANGSIASPVSFTSIDDDTLGGDTNGNSGATTPVAGAWGGITVGQGAVVTIGNAQIDYASYINSGAATVFELTNSRIKALASGLDATVFNYIDGPEPSVNITGNTITGSGGVTVQSFSILPSGSPLTVRNNTVTSTNPDTYPLRIQDEQLTPSQLTGNTVTASKRPATAISGTLVEDWSMLASAATAYVVQGGLNVAEGVTLTIPAGNVLKFENGSALSVPGHLVANGTVAAPVVFTSIDDDTRGGDTNGNGSATLPASDSWSGVSVTGQITQSNLNLFYSSSGITF